MGKHDLSVPAPFTQGAHVVSDHLTREAAALPRLTPRRVRCCRHALGEPMRAGPKAAVDDSRLPFRSPKAGAERFAAFCRQYVVVPKGHGARRRLRLRPWQVELAASVLDATPRPRLAG
jgi:hypothetical protein